MRKQRRISANRCYHLISRIAHQAFFLDDEEKDRFVDLLFRVIKFSGVKLLGFCCMTNHIHIYVYQPEDREVGEEELLAKIKTLYRGIRLQETLDMWDTLKAEDDKLKAQPNGKICPSDFDEFKLTFIRRMFNASEMMKTLKQHFTMSYNGRHRHSGTMWESRFSSRESKPLTPDMSAVLAYVDCNPVEGGICTWPTGYKWCSWSMATNGDTKARQMYEFVYGDAAEDWNGIVALHEKAIKKRIGEIEEERRNDRKSGAKNDAPAGIVSVAPPERYAFKLERGRSDVAENILSALKNGAMSAAEIGEAVGLKSRVQLISAYLRPMLEMQLIQQTIPNSPRAPNQKYKLAS